jgi:hypothetical protein
VTVRHPPVASLNLKRQRPLYGKTVPMLRLRPES